MRIVDRMIRNGISLEDVDVAREEGRAAGYVEGSQAEARAGFAAAISVLMRDYGFDKDKVTDFLANMDLMALYMASRPEAVTEALDAADVEIRFGEGQRIAQKVKRVVLCEKCLYGDPVKTGVWDCDMIDGITSGKTVCRHYKEG